MNCMKSIMNQKYIIIHLLILIINFLISKCEKKVHELTNNYHYNTIHYKSSHFELNNSSQWSVSNTIDNTENEFISCTIDIPNLCIYVIPSQPGFQLFYDDQKFDFLNDEDWNQVIVTNNYDNIDNIDIDMIEMENEESAQSQSESKKSILETNTIRRRLSKRSRRRGRRRRRCRTKCKLKKVFRRVRSKANRMRREQKERKRVYRKLYRFGKKLGSVQLL